MKMLHKLSFLLVVVGALNWGLVGLFDYNLVTGFLGSSPMLEQTVYVLVGLSGLYIGVSHKGYCSDCKDMKKKK